MTCAPQSANCRTAVGPDALADFTDVLEKHLKSTQFLEGYWRRRDDVPAAGAMACSRGLQASVSDITLSEGGVASSDTAPLPRV